MLNDDIVAYLNGSNIKWASGDYQTGIPEGGEDQIIQWDEAKLGPQPTAEQLAAAGQHAQEAATKASNKRQAMELLQQSDWVEMPSVADPAYTPHLTNKDEFMAYRSALRALAVNPPTTEAVFPAAPSEQWTA